jgi:hypothetical protein
MNQLLLFETLEIDLYMIKISRILSFY